MAYRTDHLAAAGITAPAVGRPTGWTLAEVARVGVFETECARSSRENMSHPHGDGSGGRGPDVMRRRVVREPPSKAEAVE